MKSGSHSDERRNHDYEPHIVRQSKLVFVGSIIREIFCMLFLTI